MKVLVYGGCHAAVMQRVLTTYGPAGTDAQLVTNFKLIGKGEPFPYDRVDGQDLVIFNPILNKPAYDTAVLEAYCADRDIPTLKYTWLQWNGYYPGFQIAKLDFYRGWWCQALADAAPGYPDFEAFAADVESGAILEALVLANVEKTTSQLRAREAAGAVDIAVADYILEHYRDRRLFLTPDHPSNVLYQYVFTRIQELTGLTVGPEFYALERELQYGVEVPILPTAKRVLELAFDGEAFAHRPTWGTRQFSLREFALMHYDQEGMSELVSGLEASAADATDSLVV